MLKSRRVIESSTLERLHIGLPKKIIDKSVLDSSTRQAIQRITRLTWDVERWKHCDTDEFDQMNWQKSIDMVTSVDEISRFAQPLVEVLCVDWISSASSSCLPRASRSITACIVRRHLPSQSFHPLKFYPECLLERDPETSFERSIIEGDRGRARPWNAILCETPERLVWKPPGGNNDGNVTF